MSEVVTLDKISTSVEKADGMVGFALDKKTGVPHIEGIEKARKVNNDVLNRLQKYEYDGSEDERKKNTKFLAAVRKYQKGVSTEAKKFKTKLFEQFDAELKEFNGDIDAIIALANERKAQSDAAFKAQRHAALEETFNAASVLVDCIEDLDLDNFTTPTMYNRSTTEKNAVAALNENIDTFEEMVNGGLTPEWSAEELASSLDMHDWNAIKTISAYKEEMEEKKRLEMLAAQEKIEKESTKVDRVVYTISVSKNDSDKMFNALKRAKIDYEVIK